MKTFLAAWLLLLASTAAADDFEIASPGECARCHPRAQVEWRAGAHAEEGIPCIGCHRGEAGATEAEAGHRGMRRFEQPREIATVCGECHAQPARMLPYNLATDQLMLYRESAHGRARLAGDSRAPVCTDCHQNHRVLPAADPASPAFGPNLVETCGRCHGDPALAEEHGLDPRVVESFATSPHGRALASRSPKIGPSCGSCHDTHGAAIPALRHVDERCGACHEATREYLRTGSHRKLLEREELAGCASCHPVHAGLRARSLGDACSDCHDRESSQVALGGDLSRLLRESHEEVARARQAVFEAQRIPLPVRDHEGLVGEANDYLRQARTRLHAFRREPIEDLTRASTSIALRVQREVHHSLERKSAGIAVVALWTYALITLGVLAHYRRRALERGSS